MIEWNHLDGTVVRALNVESFKTAFAHSQLIGGALSAVVLKPVLGSQRVHTDTDTEKV